MNPTYVRSRLIRGTRNPCISVRRYRPFGGNGSPTECQDIYVRVCVSYGDVFVVDYSVQLWFGVTWVNNCFPFVPKMHSVLLYETKVVVNVFPLYVPCFHYSINSFSFGSGCSAFHCSYRVIGTISQSFKPFSVDVTDTVQSDTVLSVSGTLTRVNISFSFAVFVIVYAEINVTVYPSNAFASIAA